jgi:hypothetical protein
MIGVIVMLISTIQFEIRNVKENYCEQFVIENTLENQELVFTHRYTREIKFVEMLTFDFAKNIHIPAEFLQELALAMFDEYYEIEGYNELRDGFSPIGFDEMTGVMI